MNRDEQIKSLAAALEQAWAKAAAGENYDDCCITLEKDGRFEYWNSASAYSHCIDVDRIAIERAWDLGGDYGTGDGMAYAEAFYDDIMRALES
jgi:hypothetical protein